MFKSTVFGALLAISSVGVASAATVDFDGSPNGVSSPLVVDGFSFDVARITNGNCAALDCLALNPEHGQSAADFDTMMLVGGGAFNLTSLWFQLLGGPAALVITSYDAFGVALDTATYGDPPYDHNVGYTLNFGGLFDNVFAVSFTNPGTGNVRVDDINASPVATVPVPAAAGLLALALGGLGLAGRRKKA